MIRHVVFSALCVVIVLGCEREGGFIAPSAEVNSPACDDEPALCGPTDGKIHDASGGGTLTEPGGDPAPGQPGIWLGASIAPRFCYANYNMLVTDLDHDWLDDQCEYALAKAFAPAIAMDPGDGCPGGEPYWAVKYFPDKPSADWTASVRIAYMPSYYLDCGDDKWGTAHYGDAELIMLGVTYNWSTRHWEVKEAFLSAHQGSLLTGSSDYIGPTELSQLSYPARSRAYPLVWVADGKHANYRSRDACNGGALGADDCSGNLTQGRLRLYKPRNVGSRFQDNYPNGVASANPQFYSQYTVEYFYYPRHFRGWQLGADQNTSAAGYYYALNSVLFECASRPSGDPTHQLECVYWGEGPNPPSSTIMLADVNGPSQVTAFQTYNWGSLVTGGNAGYQAEWWRRYASQGAATLVGTSQGGSGYSAGSWTGTVDRCENFTLTLKVWSGDGQYRTDDHAVTVACPPPPLAVYISGTNDIRQKNTYTWQAMPSGGVGGYTYSWSIYYLDSGLTETLGTNKTQSRTVYGNEGHFEVRVTVTSGTQTQAATLSVSNCVFGCGPPVLN